MLKKSNVSAPLQSWSLIKHYSVIVLLKIRTLVAPTLKVRHFLLRVLNVYSSDAYTWFFLGGAPKHQCLTFMMILSISSEFLGCFGNYLAKQCPPPWPLSQSSRGARFPHPPPIVSAPDTHRTSKVNFVLFLSTKNAPRTD